MSFLKKMTIAICISFSVCRWSYAQTETKIKWDQVEKTFNAIKLKEFHYKKGSLYNEAEGVTDEYEMPTGFFFSLSDSTNKSLAFVLSIQPLKQFAQDGIIGESVAYVYQG